MADNKGRIRFLRTNGITNTNKTTKLWAGQPFYDMSTKHLYVGQEDGAVIAYSTPIVADANNIVFNCTYDGTTNPKKLSCSIPGYKNIENQRAFLICGSDISAGTSNINLYINQEDRGVITIPSCGINANILYQLEYTEDTTDVYSWKINNLRTTESDYTLYHALSCIYKQTVDNTNIFELENNIDDEFFKKGNFPISFNGFDDDGVDTRTPKNGDKLVFKNGNEYSIALNLGSMRILPWVLYRGALYNNQINIQLMQVPNVYYVQGKDFSASTIAKFGDYIVSKKKLLWTGDVSIASTSPIQVCSLTEGFDSNVKSFEVVCLGDGSNNYSIKVPFKNITGFSTYIIDYGFYPNASTPYMACTKLYIGYSSSNNPAFYGSCAKQEYYINTQQTNEISVPMNVTKIYEIIE